jgi:Tol biopolymer transport system component
MSRKYALIIGNSEYDDKTLAELETPDSDVRSLAEALRNSEIGGFEEVLEVVNQSEAQVRRAISTFFKKKKRNDLLLLYFSGHGVLDDKGRLFLAVRDTQRELLNATSIPASYISEDMDTCRSKRQILILDCCHSGAFARGTKGDAPALTQITFEGNGYGRVVLTASDSTQYALEGDQIIEKAELSLFTHHLIKGLESGEADYNGDGWITLDEWYDFAYEQIINQTPNQTPQKWAYNQQGDLVIAKNRIPQVISAGELPHGLVEAMTSQFSSVRAEAVEELGRLLRSKDRALSLAAYEALAQIASNDDSRSVSNSAAQIVAASDVGVNPEPQISVPEEMAVEVAPKPGPALEVAENEVREGIEKPKSELVIDELPVVDEIKVEEVASPAVNIVEPKVVAPKEEVVTIAEAVPRQVESTYPRSVSTYPAPAVDQGETSSGARSPILLLLGIGGLGVIGLIVVVLLFWGLSRGFGASPVPNISTPTPTDTAMPTQTQPIQETEVTTLLEPTAIPSEEVAIIPSVQITDTPIPTLLGGGGGRIAYALDVDGRPQIYMMNVDGSGKTRLTHSSGEDSYPVWSPDGGSILYHSNREGNNFDIYRMNPDGSGITKLTNDPRASTFPDWAPDGSQIVFQSKREGSRQIYVMHADGSHQTRLTDDPTNAYHPSWSPDGSRIAFVSERDGNPEINLMNPDGSHQTRLTEHHADDLYPSWSPDGRHIVFISNRNGNFEIYYMNADGSGLTRLTNTMAEERRPVWSPDGELIAFASDLEGGFEIYVMDVNGEGILRLTDNGGDSNTPTWSP